MDSKDEYIESRLSPLNRPDEQTINNTNGHDEWSINPKDELNINHKDEWSLPPCNGTEDEWSLPVQKQGARENQSPYREWAKALASIQALLQSTTAILASIDNQKV